MDKSLLAKNLTLNGFVEDIQNEYSKNTSFLTWDIHYSLKPHRHYHTVNYIE